MKCLWVYLWLAVYILRAMCIYVHVHGTLEFTQLHSTRGKTNREIGRMSGREGGREGSSEGGSM